MKKSLITFGAAVMTVFLAANTASAGNSINDRQHNQTKRILGGVANGALNIYETGRLVRGAVRIKKMERRFKSDGNFTIVERARVQHRLNHQSRRINRLKTN